MSAVGSTGRSTWRRARVPALRLPGCYLPGLRAEQLTTTGNLELNKGFTATGEVRLHGAHIGGRLTFATATLSNPRGRALQAERLTVEQDLFFTEGFRATGEMHLAGPMSVGRSASTERRSAPTMAR